MCSFHHSRIRFRWLSNFDFRWIWWIEWCLTDPYAFGRNTDLQSKTQKYFLVDGKLFLQRIVFHWICCVFDPILQRRLDHIRVPICPFVLLPFVSYSGRNHCFSLMSGRIESYCYRTLSSSLTLPLTPSLSPSSSLSLCACISILIQIKFHVASNNI